MSDEDAKAAQEIAKAAGKLIDAGRELGSGIKSLLGDAIEEWVGSLADKIKFRRWKNSLEISDKVDAIIEERGLQGKTIPIPPRIAIPIIEKIASEDYPRLQEMWASLIVNAGDPSRSGAASRKYVDILQALDPLDARVLDFLDTQGWKSTPDPRINDLTFGSISLRTDVDEKNLRQCLENLFRLGCVADIVSLTFDDAGNAKSGLRWDKKDARFYLTPLGRGFLEACRRSASTPQQNEE